VERLFRDRPILIQINRAPPLFLIMQHFNAQTARQAYRVLGRGVNVLADQWLP
jgi:hypothetical protein